MTLFNIAHPYLMFLGEAKDQLAAKTASGIAFWRPDWALGQLRLPGCQADLQLPDWSPAQAVQNGCKTLVIGVAFPGGKMPAHWLAVLLDALDQGLDIASGLHSKLSDLPELVERAQKLGRQLYDVRHPTFEFDTGTGRRRHGKRLLAVGTDCNLGKMYTTLALERAMRQRGMRATFRATGQTGIFIAGTGVAVDAVVADFISGATEWLTPDNEPDHWDLIEGQGSLFHPAFAGVSLGLLHGAAADVLIMCHEPTRKHVRGLSQYPIIDLPTCIRVNEELGRLTNPDCRVVGLAVNTSALGAEAAKTYLAQLEQDLGLPAVDPVATGVDKLVEVLSTL